MITDVILIMVSCVLFIQMGLADAIQSLLKVKFRILSCVKCSTFWFSLIYLLVNKTSLLLSVSTSFIASYVALWAALIYDTLARKYNNIYEQITSTEGADSHAESSGQNDTKKAGRDEVRKMQKK